MNNKPIFNLRSISSFFFIQTYQILSRYKFTTTLDNLLIGKSTLSCALVTTPVATVLLNSRIVNRWPLGITIFLNVVRRTLPWLPGIIISPSTVELELNWIIRMMNIFRVISQMRVEDTYQCRRDTRYSTYCWTFAECTLMSLVWRDRPRLCSANTKTHQND